MWFRKYEEKFLAKVICIQSVCRRDNINAENMVYCMAVASLKKYNPIII